jgi:TfoX/Sxy family transcriptional regulator of competence genes
MAYSEELAERIRKRLPRRKNVEERKMFGGIGFLLNGNLLVGVWKDSLIVRLGPEQGGEALLEPHVKVFDITGKPMKNWILVEPGGIEDDKQLTAWIQRAVKFVGKLPAKEK